MSVLKKKECWDNEDYPKLKESFFSDLRLTDFYSRIDKNYERSPPGVAKKLLLYALQNIIMTYQKDRIIVAEVDFSPENDLVNKVYIPMGFIMLSPMKGYDELYPNGAGGLMVAKIREVVDRLLNLHIEIEKDFSNLVDFNLS